MNILATSTCNFINASTTECIFYTSGFSYGDVIISTFLFLIFLTLIFLLLIERSSGIRIKEAYKNYDF